MSTTTKTRTNILTNIPIKYKHGDTWFSTNNASTAMCRQALSAIQGELRSLSGEYVWTLEGDTGSWYVRASYEGGFFHECCDCKTAADAMLSTPSVLTVLRSHDRTINTHA